MMNLAMGLAAPIAIRDFLSYAYDNWQNPAPQYVLLVGDGSFDYKDNLKYRHHKLCTGLYGGGRLYG